MCLLNLFAVWLRGVFQLWQQRFVCEVKLLNVNVCCDRLTTYPGCTLCLISHRTLWPWSRWAVQQMDRWVEQTPFIVCDINKCCRQKMFLSHLFWFSTEISYNNKRKRIQNLSLHYAEVNAACLSAHSHVFQLRGLLLPDGLAPSSAQSQIPAPVNQLTQRPTGRLASGLSTGLHVRLWLAAGR